MLSKKSYGKLALAILIFIFSLINICSSQTRRKEIKLLGVSIDSLLQSPIKEIDTTYIVPYYHYLHVHPLVEDRNYSLFITGNDQTIIYKPNVASSVGVGLAYKWFSFDFTFKIPFSDKAIGRKGKTKQLGLGFSYTGRRIWFNTYFQSAKGLYLSNPEQIDIDWFVNNTGYPLREDLTVRTLFTRGYYHFNYKKFSNPAAFSFQERQRKSTGSFILGGSFVSFQIRSDSSLLLLTENDLANNNELTNHNSYSLTINPGYVYTFVIKKYFFVTGAVRPGLAFKLNETHNVDSRGNEHNFLLGWQGDAFATVGFNNERYYGAFSYSLLFFSDNLEKTGVLSTHSYLRFLIGRRFNFKPKGVLKEIPGFN